MADDRKAGAGPPPDTLFAAIPHRTVYAMLWWPVFGALVAFGLFQLSVFMGDQATLATNQTPPPVIPITERLPYLQVVTDLSYLAAGAGLSLIVSAVYFALAAGILFMTIRAGLDAAAKGQVRWQLVLTLVGLFLAGAVIVVVTDPVARYHAADLFERIINTRFFKDADQTKVGSDAFRMFVHGNIVGVSIDANYIAVLSIALAAGGVLFRAVQRPDAGREALRALPAEEKRNRAAVEQKRRDIKEARARQDLRLLSVLMVGGAIVFFCQLAVLNVWYGLGLHFVDDEDFRTLFGSLLDASLIYWSVVVMGAVLGTYGVLYITSCRIVGVSPVRHLPFSRAEIPKVLALASPLFPSIVNGLSNLLAGLDWPSG